MAQMAAVLQHGLRITPFSGGSLGKGIYLTPEHAKASWNGKAVNKALACNKRFLENLIFKNFHCMEE